LALDAEHLTTLGMPVPLPWLIAVPAVLAAVPAALAGQGAPRRAAGGPAADVHRCGVPALGALPRDSAAVRCAEWFVARNGYTDQAPADTAELAGESLQFHGGDWPRILAGRRNTLARRAAVLCQGALGRPG
jgi:hypothetical protein